MLQSSGSNAIYRIITRCLCVGILLLSVPAQALELRLGKGDFEIGAGIAPLFNADFTLDIETLTLAQNHQQIMDSRLFYQFRLDYFESSYLNQITDLASLPVNTPLPGTDFAIDTLIDQYTAVPVPADYRIHGINFDISLGIDLFKTAKGYLGLGINTGLSMPYMKTRNLESDANLVMDLLDTFKTDIQTWKLGPALHFGYTANDWLSLNGNLIWNYQTGRLDNDYLGSGIDIDGSYTSLEMNATLKPLQLFSGQTWLHNWTITAGYSRSSWDYDRTRVNIRSNSITIPQILDMDFSQDNLYLGIGYNF